MREAVMLKVCIKLVKTQTNPAAPLLGVIFANSFHNSLLDNNKAFLQIFIVEKNIFRLCKGNLQGTAVTRDDWNSSIIFTTHLTDFKT